MGNRVAHLPFIIVLAFSLLMVPLLSHAATGRSDLTKRLCDRQAILGDRLPRALIDPALCADAPPPPVATLTFTATPSSIVSGNSATLAWSAQNVGNCVASNGWTGSKSTSGSQAVSPTATTTYTLSCNGAGGSIEKSVTVNVTPVAPATPELTFTASPTSVNQGATSTLTWVSTNTTSCTASNGWSGAKATSGTLNVFPSATTTYALECAGPGGVVSKTVVVNVVVQPATPTLTFTATPSSIPLGQSGTLEWTSTNTTSCTGSDGAKPLNGSAIVAPTTTTTYVLDCTGPGGGVHKEVTVTVTAALVPTVTLIASPTSVTPGAGSATTTLTWTSTNVSSCTASGGTWTGAKALNNSEVITPTATRTYVLSCTGVNGSAAATTTVVFVPTPAPVPALTFTATPTVVTPGAGSATSTLAWSAQNVSVCLASNGWTGERALSGSLVVGPVATTTYQLECGGENGTTAHSVTVNLVPAAPVQTIGHLVISEVYYDVASTTVSGNDSSFEWMELYNGTDSAVNLQNWIVGDASSTADLLPSMVIQPGGYAVVVASTTPAGIPVGVPVLVLFSSIGFNGFANDGDAAVLKNVASTTIDTVGFGNNNTVTPNVPIPGVHDGHSLYRVQLTSDTDTAADWADTALPTPGY